MILDNSFQLSTNQAITTASAYSTNNQDLGAVLRDIGGGSTAQMDLVVTQSFAIASGTPTLNMHLVLASSSTSPALPFLTFIGSSVAYEAGDLVAGTHIPIPLMALSDAQRNQMKTAASISLPLRYLFVYYQLTSGTFNAGTFSAALTAGMPTRMTAKHYADAQN